MGVANLAFFFFFNDTATTEIYTLSLHDALPILRALLAGGRRGLPARPLRARRAVVRLDLRRPSVRRAVQRQHHRAVDRKSTRLNSSHANISYAVFCLKKKKKRKHDPPRNVTIYA